jgi:serine/threonine protein kinase
MQDLLCAPAASALPTRLGRYQIIETLGQGGMGTIQLAWVGGLGQFRKLVVLKVLRDELARDERFVEMFMREAALAACLSHPNVVQTIEAGHVDDRYFLVMEFLDGQPLNRVLRRATREPVVPLALRLQVLCSALQGLHYAHELTGYDGRPLHMVHRDVSPSNVFVTYDGQVKLLDFGIAEARASEESQPGAFKGKLGYAAPEQLRGLPSDRRSDVFSAGVVLWETIALRHLSHGSTARQTFAARLAGTDPSIREVVPEVDPALAEICERALQHDLAQRYQSADALRRALQSYLAERGETFEPAQIGALMRHKFANERAIMHRVIDAQLREPLDGDSHVVATRACQAPRDLSAPLASSFPSDEPASESGARPADAAPVTAPRSPRTSLGRLRAKPLWIALLSLVVVMLGLLVQGREVDVPRASPPRAADARLRAPSLARSAQAVVAPPAPPEDEGVGQAELATKERHTLASRGDQSGSARLSARAGKPVERSTARTPKGEIRPDVKTARRARRARATTPRPARGAASAVSDAAEAQRGVRPGVENDAAAAPVDLARVPKPARRQLDVHNPFR